MVCMGDLSHIVSEQIYEYVFKYLKTRLPGAYYLKWFQQWLLGKPGVCLIHFYAYCRQCVKSFWQMCYRKIIVRTELKYIFTSLDTLNYLQIVTVYDPVAGPGGCYVCCILWVCHPPSAAYMHRWTGSALAQIMACLLYGTKPLSKLMLGYCQIDPWEQTSVKFESKYIFFSFTKMHLKISSAKEHPFCPQVDELSLFSVLPSPLLWQISHSAPFRNRCAHVHISAKKMVHCAIWDLCIMGFGIWFIEPHRIVYDDVTT